MKEWRAQTLARVITAVRSWHSVYALPLHWHERFRGPPGNARDEPRTDKKDTIYKECFSSEWVNKSEEYAQAYARAPRMPETFMPETFSIFGLEIPEDLISEGDRAWLADKSDSVVPVPEAEVGME